MSFDEIFDLTAGVYFHFLQYTLGSSSWRPWNNFSPVSSLCVHVLLCGYHYITTANLKRVDIDLRVEPKFFGGQLTVDACRVCMSL